ncbi:MAG: hypothetical protein A4S16_00340 [Proteobacteria bacterium SG_bin6]|nr:MAG: hypothetical protein A4S16_00340 [Proteobacteria bacterium SG_bin6]
MPPVATPLSRPVRARNLIGYEVRLLRGAIAQSFPRPTDWAMLLIVALVGVTFLHAQLPALAGAIRQWMPLAGLAIAAVIGFAASRFAWRRLDDIADGGILLAEALDPAARQSYLGVHQLLALAVLASATGDVAWHARALPDFGYLAASIAGYALGCWAAAMLDQLPPTRLPPAAMIDAKAPGGAALNYPGIVRQLQIRPLPLPWPPIGVAIGIGLVTALACTETARMAGLPAGLTVEILLLAPAAGLLSRTDDQLLRFGRFAGIGVARGLRSHLILATIACLTVAAGSALVQPPLAIAALGIGTLILWVRTLMLLLATLHPKRIAKLRVQLEITAAVLLGYVLPPLGLLVAIGRPVQLYRLSVRRRWDAI